MINEFNAALWVVTTQAELDEAVKQGATSIRINSPETGWLRLDAPRTSRVVARGSSRVVARGSSSVVARGSSRVEARGSSRVVARDSSSVEARGSSRVVARDTASVVARGSSRVEAWGAVSLSVYDSVIVKAGSTVSGHRHSVRAGISGGVVIDHMSLDLSSPLTWCEYHGITVVDGIATVYKAVDSDFRSAWGADYSPGSTPEAADWRDRNECGHGLHFSPSPLAAGTYHSDPDARYLRVGIALDEMRPITGTGGAPKCKARRVIVPCVEVDRWGDEVKSQ